MTVAELRRALESLPDNMPVALFSGDDVAWVDATGAEVIAVVRDRYTRIPDRDHEPDRAAEYDAAAAPALCIHFDL